MFTVQGSGPEPQRSPAPEEWLAALARVRMLHQPGEAWLYYSCSDILGVLIARVAGCPLPEFPAERLFAPLGMVDTGFAFARMLLAGGTVGDRRLLSESPCGR